MEPGALYVHGWHIDAICEHLEAIAAGAEIDGRLFNRFLANVPPGMMKSLCVSVFFPAWLWGPKNQPHLRFLCASHSMDLAIRDNMRMRRLVSSGWFKTRWGSRVKLAGDQNAKTKFETDAGGFRQAVAAGSITGARGDYVIIDDPHSVEGGGSDAMRQTTIEWFTEAVPTRLNNPEKSVIIVIMQRLHEEDVSGVIIERDLGYEHLCLPMRFDPSRKCITGIGFEDPREEPGELLFPQRFPAEVVARDEHAMGGPGSYAVSGQFQQEPFARGGGILQRDWWQVWDEAEALAHGSTVLQYPLFEYMIGWVDSAYTEKQENDPSAMTVWGVWIDRHGNKRVMLVYAWSKHLAFNPLVLEVARICKKYKLDRLLIENKAAGISLGQEMRRLYSNEDWMVQLVDPKGMDKVARAHAVSHILEQGIVYAPDTIWADMVISQCASFPKGKHDDLVDCVTGSLAHLRAVGMAVLPEERRMQIEDAMTHKPGSRLQPLYPG